MITGWVTGKAMQRGVCIEEKRQVKIGKNLPSLLGDRSQEWTQHEFIRTRSEIVVYLERLT